MNELLNQDIDKLAREKSDQAIQQGYHIDLLHTAVLASLCSRDDNTKYKLKKQGLTVGKRGVFTSGKIPFRINKTQYLISPIYIDPQDLASPDALGHIEKRERTLKLVQNKEIVFEVRYAQDPRVQKLKHIRWTQDLNQISLLYKNHLQFLRNEKEAERLRHEEGKLKKKQLKAARKKAQKLRDFGEKHNKWLARQQDIIDKYEHLTSGIKQILRGLFKLGYLLFCLSVVTGIIIFTRWWSIILLIIALPLLAQGGKMLFPKK